MADGKTSYQYTYLQLEGPLQKKSLTKVGLAHTWQARYFVFNSKDRCLYYYADKNERLRNENATIVPFATFVDIELFPDKKNGRRFDLLTSNPSNPGRIHKYELLATSARDAYNWYQLLRFFLPRAHKAAQSIQRLWARFKNRAHGRRMMRTIRLAQEAAAKETREREEKDAKRDAARAASAAKTAKKTSGKMGRLALLRAKREKAVAVKKEKVASEFNMSVDNYDAHAAGAEACGMGVDEYIAAQAAGLGMTVAGYGACAESAAAEGVSPEEHVSSRAEAAGMEFEAYAAHIEDAAAVGLSGDAYSLVYHLSYEAGQDIATYVAANAAAAGLEEAAYRAIASVAATWSTTPEALIAAAAAAGVAADVYAKQVASGESTLPPTAPPPAVADAADAADTAAPAPAGGAAAEGSYEAAVAAPAVAAAGPAAAVAAAPAGAPSYAPPAQQGVPSSLPPPRARSKSKGGSGKKLSRKSSSRRGKRKGKFNCSDPHLKEAWHCVKDDFDETNWFLMSYESHLGAFDKKTVALLGKGSGGFSEMVAHLADDRIIWGGFRCSACSDHHEIPKYVFITWVGCDIPATRGAVVGTETHTVRAQFRGSHHTVTIRHREDIEIETFRSVLNHFFNGTVDLNVGGWTGGEGSGGKKPSSSAEAVAAVEEAYEAAHAGEDHAAADAAADALGTDWEPRDDPSSGRNFYWNRVSGATTWDIGETDLPQPEGSGSGSDEDSGSESGEESSGEDESSEDHGPLPENWSEVADPATGRSYYHNGVTGESSWTFPEA